MPPGSAITVAETTTVTGTATGTRATADYVGLATIQLPSSGAQPRYLQGELITVSGFSDSAFNVTNSWIAHVDYGAAGGEKVSYYISTTGSGTATGGTVTSFDDDKYESMRIWCANGVQYGGGSATCSTGQFTVQANFLHSSSANNDGDAFVLRSLGKPEAVACERFARPCAWIWRGTVRSRRESMGFDSQMFQLFMRMRGSRTRSNLLNASVESKG